MPDTSGGKVTPISAGVIARLTQAARYVVSGVTPETWFGPNQPIAPVAPPEVAGRAWDYATGFNLNYTPRGDSEVKFSELRALADNCDVLRSVIETRKDQICALKWNVRVKHDPDKKQATITADQKKRIAAITDFFQSPDKDLNFNEWLRSLVEDILVIDAVAIYKRPTRGNGLYGLELIDGSTIKPLIDDTGRTPVSPGPAYQQVLHNVPAVNYTREELIYYRNNPRTNSVYGYSRVEQIIITVNTLIRRALHQLEYYRSGSVPDAFVGLPKEWNTDQIVSFQKSFDALISGNSAVKRKVKFMPGEFKYQETKAPMLKDEYDEWLARIVCFCFSIAPTPFIKQNNRATGETAKDSAKEEGLQPLKEAICNLLTPIIRNEFKSPDLEFAFEEDGEQDPFQQMQINTGYAENGIMTIDEARERLGLEPWGGAAAELMVKTMTGYVSIDPADNQPDPDPNAGGNNLSQTGKKPTGQKKKPKPAEKAVYSRLRKAGGQEPIPFHRPETDNAADASEIELVAVLAATRQSVLDQLKNELESATPTEIAAGLDLSALNALVTYLQPYLKAVYLDAATKELVRLDIDDAGLVNQVNERAVQFAKDRAAEMVGKRWVDGELVDSANAEMVITETTREEIKSIITQGLEDNLGRDWIATQIEQAFAFSPERARLIADAEVGNANGDGILGAMFEARAAGLDLEKQWYPDPNACDVCLANAEAGPIPLDQPFPGGVQKPLQHPRCECTMLGVPKETKTE